MAIAEGVVRVAREADGYGGVVAIEHTIQGENYIAIYGHLDVDSLTIAVGDSVSPGQVIGVLGIGYSEETDGERKHLHFSLIPGTKVDLKGYVQPQTELNTWIDPLLLFGEN